MPVAPCHFSVTISLTWFVPLLLEKQEKFMIKCVIKKKNGEGMLACVYSNARHFSF